MVNLFIRTRPCRNLHPTVRIRLGIFLFPAAMHLMGCDDGTPQPAPIPIALATGIDTSESGRPSLPLFVKGAGEFAAQLDPAWDRLAAWRVDRHTQELPIARPPSSRETFGRGLVPLLRPRAKTDFTLTQGFWQAVAVRAERWEGPIIVAFFTDGFTEGMNLDGHRQVRAAAERLAANKRVIAVCVVGARPGTVEALRADLAALEGRLHFWPLAGASSEFRTLLAEAGGRR